jgi:inosine-uridine nucleoside N-ribohydrolase
VGRDNKNMRILIDTDPAIGMRFKDIDDGLALLFLIASSTVSIEGITINFGNVSADKGYSVAKRLLKLVKVDFPIFKGAESRNDLGKSNPAVDFLIETVRKNPKEITLLALAPLTNIATAMMLDNSFAHNLKNLIIMGGALHFRPFSFFGEFNFHRDGKAASLVMSSPIAKTLITMDVCSQAVFKREHLEKFQNHNSDVARFLARTISPWLNKMRFITGKGGFYPWDVVAAAYFVDDSLFDKNFFTLKIQERGMRSGRIYHCVKKDNSSLLNNAVPANIPLEIDSKTFMDLFINRLLNL